jgi:hypothetical protein
VYEITIKTKYNTIHLKCEDYNDPQIQEILEQPYVLEVKIEKIKTMELKK